MSNGIPDQLWQHAQHQAHLEALRQRDEQLAARTAELRQVAAVSGRYREIADREGIAELVALVDELDELLGITGGGQ